MARRTTPRKIWEGLDPQAFPTRPARTGGVPKARLTLDGLEALRLVDLLGLYHEAGARQMGVSRATFARVLAGARKTVADVLVHGKGLEISGGAVEPRREDRWPCPVHGAVRRGRGCHCAERDA